MVHKYLQPLQYPFKNMALSGKTETLSKLLAYIVENNEEYKNGEEVTIRFIGEDSSIISTLVIINKTDDEISLSANISDNETHKIVETKEAPKDENALWLREVSGTTPEELEYDVKYLNAIVKNLINIVSRHEFAFTTIMDAGDLETNNTRKTLMETATPIKPDILEEEVTNTTAAEEIEPDYENYNTPNLKSLCIKGAATETIIKANVANINERELILCEENLYLYSKLNGNLIKINGSSGGGGSQTGSTEEIMSGITQNGDSIASIRFIASTGKKYIVKVDDNGKLISYSADLDEKHAAPISGTPGEYGTTLFEQKLYINSIYCGGTDAENNNVEINEHSLNYCSHNFIELSNLTNNDINLSGLSIQYTISAGNWETLPLKGLIKSGGTFLIRGAQCSVMDANTTIIKVDKYDMEWNVIETVEGKEVQKPIQFSNKAAKFYLTYGQDACGVANPWKIDASGTTKALYGYIDLVGMDNKTESIDAYESGSTRELSSSRIMTKYYTMDPVKQATKALNARNNANDWQYIDLSKNDVIPNVKAYKPMASSEGKNIFFNKTHLLEDRPSVVTCSLGIQATDNGSGATRCFNWISKDYYEEGVWIYSGNTLVTSGISVNNEPQTKDGQINPDYYYNRIKQEATDGTFFTVHKKIIRGLTGGTYTYIVGRTNADGTPNVEHCTNAHTLRIYTNDEVNNGFKFVQTSDQQGFNWDEYQIWKYNGRDIAKNDAKFMINTGDMTQNGNRINEWLDYFNAKSMLPEMEEMATIGNNDLCPSDIYKLGDGNDASKINPANILLYYTFELDPSNMPVFNITVSGETTQNVYVPSLYSFNYGNAHFLCLNSEITTETEISVFKVKGADSTNYGFIYDKVKEWCTQDLALYQSGKTWTIAYCHENPFTIMTDELKNSFFKDNKENTDIYRGGSHLNTVTTPNNKYWFSKFCQEHNIRLVIGGHKHTQSTTWPLKERFKAEDGNVVSMKPIIEVTLADLNTYFNNSDHLVTITGKTIDDGHLYYLNGYSYPNKWFSNEETMILDGDYASDAHFCSFELVTKPTAPIYAMSQSSGYKHTSNKELPAYRIPWERYYYPNAASGKANAGQKYPFYTIWDVGFGENAKIVGTVKKVGGLFNDSGKFNINTQGSNAKKNKSNSTTWIGPNGEPIAINGITAGQDTIDKDKTESNWLKIEILK